MSKLLQEDEKTLTQQGGGERKKNKKPPRHWSLNDLTRGLPPVGAPNQPSPQDLIDQGKIRRYKLDLGTN